MIRKLWIAIESFSGLLAAFMIGFAPVILLIIGALLALATCNVTACVLCLAVGLPAGWAASRVAKLAGTVIERQGSLWPPDVAFEPDAAIDDERFGFEDRPPPPVAPALALEMARELPRLPVPAGAVLCLWWLCHFGLAAAAGHASADFVSRSLDRPTALTVFLIGLGLRIAFLFAANLYLVLAVAVVWRQPIVWQSLWRYRVPIDLLLAVGAMLVPQFV